MKIKHKITLAATMITVVGAIIVAVINVKWGQDNVNVTVLVNGQEVVLDDSAVQTLADEKEELQSLVSDYEKKIENGEYEM